MADQDPSEPRAARAVLDLIIEYQESLDARSSYDWGTGWPPAGREPDAIATDFAASVAIMAAPSQ